MSLKPRKATKHAPTLSGVFLLILCAGTLTSGYTSAAAQSKPFPAAGMAKQRDPNTSSPGAKGSQSIDDAKAGPVREANRPAGEVALNPDSKRATMEEGGMADRINALEEAMRLQNEKLDQMQRIIEEQQRTIQLLAGKPAAEKLGSSNIETTATASMPEKSEGTIAISGMQKTAPSPEDRLQKIEERLQKIGPLRLSGDFRLRLDGIFRSATKAPDPPLAHQQNVRMRYRLRLNFDADVNPALSFHGQLTTGPINNPLTLDQDFTSTVAHHPFFINQAWIDYHPKKNVQLQGGRVQEVFEDNSRFLFDADLSFNGFNERIILPLSTSTDRAASIELRAGQYWFSNPNVAVITAGSPLALAGADIGSIGRSANLFHQGILVNQQFSKNWNQQFGGDVQVFREPNQIQLASTPAGVVFIVQPGLGLVLSGPMTGTGNATTTQGGAIYTAEDFHVARLTYRLTNAGFTWGEHRYPITFNLQVARNFGTEQHERDAMLAALQIGRPGKRGDMSFLYLFSIKGANSIISQLTDDDLGTATGVNIRSHHFRWELGLAKNVTLQSLFFVQRQLRDSGQFPNFFVPLGAFAPRQYRFQEQMVFSF